MRNKLLKCKVCGADIARNAKSCPACGAKNKITHPVIGIVAVIAVFIICIPIIMSIPSENPPDSHTTPKSVGSVENEKSQIIFDDNDIKITYTGMELIHYLPNQADGYMLTVNLTIENESDRDIVVLPMDSSVNDVMKTAVSGIPMSVLAGKKLISNFSFANLEGTGIEPPSMDGVESVSFSLTIANNDTFENLYQSDPITVNP